MLRKEEGKRRVQITAKVDALSYTGDGYIAGTPKDNQRNNQSCHYESTPT